MIALVLAMLVTHGGGGGETVPEYLLQSIERCVTSGGIDGSPFKKGGPVKLLPVITTSKGPRSYPCGHTPC